MPGMYKQPYKYWPCQKADVLGVFAYIISAGRWPGKDWIWKIIHLYLKKMSIWQAGIDKN